MAGQKSRSRFGDRAVLPIELGDQLCDERLPHRSVVGRVGEDVVPERTARVEEHPEELDAPRVLRVDRLVAKLKALTGNVICFAHGHILRTIAARWIHQPVLLGAHLLLGTATLSTLSFNHGKLDEPAIKVWNS